MKLDIVGEFIVAAALASEPAPLSVDFNEYSRMLEAIVFESIGEGRAGMSAVANVILNRQCHRKSVNYVVTKPSQFSYLNDGPAPMFKARDPKTQQALFYAARVAYNAVNGWLEDNTNGADHYLNTVVVIKQSKRLPSWYSENKVVSVVNNHTMLRLGSVGC